ncbi:preprotein translocase subunit YajC [Mesorhizobium alhagi CCNWXJ12-2]|jgi:preprotein translocase subunit YajC|uniref:Sec translocon accessory complex subunit YajC n=2 Tax=Allomesorhizobium alhagi TaxID=475067 RepID=H0HWK1_9HYPH|nr:preprotein translocase subunit YajC [Mesorhizobium alhagi CCNWXJ12-2]
MRGCKAGSSDYIPANFGGTVCGLHISGVFMFVTPAYAQGVGATPDVFISILPFVLIFVIMYFLIIRPQRQQLKKRGEMLAAIRRGDTVVTGGGLVGKVTKVIDDSELEVDLGGMKVTALRATISDVRVKGEPVANQNAKK